MVLIWGQVICRICYKSFVLSLEISLSINTTDRKAQQWRPPEALTLQELSLTTASEVTNR